MTQLTFVLRIDSTPPKKIEFVKQMAWQSDEEETRRHARHVAEWISFHVSVAFLDSFLERMAELKIVHSNRIDRDQKQLGFSSQ